MYGKQAGINAQLMPQTLQITRLYSRGGAEELRNAVESAMSAIGTSLMSGENAAGSVRFQPWAAVADRRNAWSGPGCCRYFYLAELP